MERSVDLNGVDTTLRVRPHLQLASRLRPARELRACIFVRAPLLRRPRAVRARPQSAAHERRAGGARRLTSSIVPSQYTEL
ncbi:hypothetical protein B5X24_HaOG202995 [Helicoverpa armigera]|uniref:Uncharacterized protein n=1 Tax=Helicoverpa armigera TaxID=29058 RepID=A0A2W1BTS3_HELAM|nr:hypothetical protein B5X24_HaOG202995 [Helicoverpa armigera]